MFPDAVEEVVEKLNLFFLMLYEIYIHSIRKLTRSPSYQWVIKC